MVDSRSWDSPSLYHLIWGGGDPPPLEHVRLMGLPAIIYLCKEIFSMSKGFFVSHLQWQPGQRGKFSVVRALIEPSGRCFLCGGFFLSLLLLPCSWSCHCPCCRSCSLFSDHTARATESVQPWTIFCIKLWYVWRYDWIGYNSMSLCVTKPADHSSGASQSKSNRDHYESIYIRDRLSWWLVIMLIMVTPVVGV